MSPSRLQSWEPSTAAGAMILGAILAESGALDDVSQTLDADDFADERQATVYRTMCRLAAAGQRPEWVAVAESLEADGQLDRIGGREYLMGLDALAAPRKSVAQHAALLRGNAVRRRMVAMCEWGISQAKRTPPDASAAMVETFLGRAFKTFETSATHQPVSMAGAMAGALDDARRLHTEPGADRGVSTGFLDVDAIFRWQPGELVVLGARPKMGKTALAVRFARNVAIGGDGVVYLSTEVPVRHLGRRVLAAESGVDGARMVRGDLGPEEVDRLVAASAEAREWGGRLIAHHRAGATVGAVRSLIRYYRCIPAAPPLRLVVVDHASQMRDVGRSDGEQKAANICAGLQQTACEEDVALLALYQLNRQCESRPDKRPQTHDLRGSGQVEQDASVIAFLYRDHAYHSASDPTLAELAVEANRNGPTGKAELRYTAATGRFDNLSKRYDGR